MKRDETSREAPTIDLRVEPQSLQRQAVDKLRQAILAGVFQPGDRLVEARLCGMLGISRASVREALRSLEAERLVEIIPNKGPQIPVITWEQAEQIYEVRSLLEGRAAQRCARLAGPEDVRQLERAIAAFQAAAEAEDMSGCLAATSEFYATILRASGNGVIEHILNSLHVRVSFLRARSMSLEGRAKVSHAEMAAILDAIRRKDPEAALEAAERHVEEARRAARQHYAK